MKIAKCKNCNNEFNKKNSRHIYCSSSCREDYKYELRECILCKKKFKSRKTLKTETSRYCIKCMRKKFPTNRGVKYSKLVDVQCETCGLKFKREQNRIKERIFCSPKCSHIGFQNRRVRNCSNCGKEISKKASDFFLPSGKEKTEVYCSVECMGEHYSEKGRFSGANSGTWNGGKIGYKGITWSKQRRKARKRDNYTCQRCGILEEECGDKELSVHHIIPFALWNDSEEANNLENLITLCEACHRKEHSGDNHPSKFNETYKKFIEKQNTILDNDIV